MDTLWDWETDTKQGEIPAQIKYYNKRENPAKENKFRVNDRESGWFHDKLYIWIFCQGEDLHHCKSGMMICSGTYKVHIRTS